MTSYYVVRKIIRYSWHIFIYFIVKYANRKSSFATKIFSLNLEFIVKKRIVRKKKDIVKIYYHVFYSFINIANVYRLFISLKVHFYLRRSYTFVLQIPQEKLIINSRIPVHNLAIPETQTYRG